MFLKNQNLAQNPNVLASDFTEKHQFVAQTDQNSIFLTHEAHIKNRLYIMVMYINFYRF
jgi:hypothetical protein